MSRVPGVSAVGPTISTVAAASVGQDRSRLPYPTDDRFWISSATWAQRAVNAWRALASGRGAPIVVDGRAGPVTIAALQAINPATQVAPYPTTRDVSDRILIERSFAADLERLPLVADPAAPARSSEAASSELEPELVVDAPPPRRSILPWVVGVGAVVAISAGLYLWWTSRKPGFAGLEDGGFKTLSAKGDPRGHVTASATLNGVGKKKAAARFCVVRKGSDRSVRCFTTADQAHRVAERLGATVRKK